MNRRSTILLAGSNWLLLILLLVGGLVVAQEPAWDLEQRVASSGDDAEEFLANSSADPQRWPAGFSYAESSDLELGRDPAHGPQMVGLHFSGLQIPPGARISQAVIEFTADSDNAEPLALSIRAQDAVEAEPFIQDEDRQGSFDLSSRPATLASQTWSPEPWSEGQVYQSPDVAGLLQGVVDREGWQSGGSLVLLLSRAPGAGGGLRSAYSFEGDPQQAPRLLVRFAGSAAAEEAADDMADAEVPDPTVVPEAAAEPVVPEAAAEPEPAEVAGPEETDPVEAERPPGKREPIRVEPVDPDPIVPPPKGEGPQLVWPGPAAPKGEAEESLREPEAADPEPLAEPAPERRDEPLAEPRRERFPLTANFQRGVEGSVLLSDYGGGVTVVTLFLDNPVPSVTYAASLRRGRCGSSGRLVVDLEPVVGSRAFSTSLLSLDFDELVGGEYQLNVYRATEEFIRVSGCASLEGG